ncbi:hypothetical protein MVI01_49270 [Myxococcus virescens]|uniref:Uncharacterized protein n=1 Tax=Myxococcus virescens TaxID=83456 RepID=A0A511HHU6_9BACT|nr:hypothetical protein MVI01_49270 [Myxococcus virescens]
MEDTRRRPENGCSVPMDMSVGSPQAQVAQAQALEVGTSSRALDNRRVTVRAFFTAQAPYVLAWRPACGVLSQRAMA